MEVIVVAFGAPELLDGCIGALDWAVPGGRGGQRIGRKGPGDRRGPRGPGTSIRATTSASPPESTEASSTGKPPTPTFSC